MDAFLQLGLSYMYFLKCQSHTANTYVEFLNFFKYWPRTEIRTKYFLLWLDVMNIDRR